MAEATRCLANVCLLQEPARLRLAAVPKITEAILARAVVCKGSLIRFLDAHASILQPRCTPTTRFLGSRLLFLLTVSSGSVIRTLVEDLNIAAYLSARLDEYTKYLSSPSPVDTGMESNIVTEHLKTIFNISLFYPRLIKEAQSNSLSPPGANEGRGSPRLGSGRSSSSSGSRSPSPSNGRPASPSNGARKTSDKIKGMFSRKPKDRSRSSSSNDDTDVLRTWGHERYAGLFPRQIRDRH